MIQKKNVTLMLLLFLICCVVLHYHESIQKDAVAMIILSGALLLLFFKKKKWWAFWCCFLLLFWGGGYITLPLIDKHIFRAILLLLGGCFLLYRFHDTGWESYVTSGCFGISFGLFGLMTHAFFLKVNIFVLLFLCLAMVWYTSRNIKKRKKSIIKIWLEVLLLFAVVIFILLR